MATQEQIQAKVDELRAKLEAKGFSFGTFQPDYQLLFTQVYAEQLAGVAAGDVVIPGGSIDWETVDPADVMATISGEITESDLYIDLQNSISDIPDLRTLVDNVLSNASEEWSSLELYGPGQIVSYGGALWENVNAILVPTTDFPSLSNEDWKQVGTYNNIYNSVDNLTTQIYNAQTTADGAVSDTNLLSTTLLGPEGDATASGIIYDNVQAIVGPEGAIVTATEQLQADFLGPEGDASAAGYLFDIILDASAEGSLANSVETLQVNVGDNSAAISTEQGIRAIALAPDYDSQVIYQNNDVAMHAGLLYQNKSGGPIGPKEWDINDGWVGISESLYGQYTVKVDINGRVAGFGLANDGATSSFIVTADTFAIADPDGVDTVLPFIVDDGKVWIDEAYIRNITASGLTIATGLFGAEGYSTVGDLLVKNELQDEDALLQAVLQAETTTQLPGINNGVENFNTRNDRITVPVTPPTILSDGTAVSFSFNSDGSANIDFKWEYSTGSPETDIDGFIIYIKADTVDTTHDFNLVFEEVQYFNLPFNQRSFRFISLTADKYYTIGIEAYRMVDQDLVADGIIRSAIVHPSLAAENPVYLDLNVPAPVGVTLTEL